MGRLSDKAKGAVNIFWAAETGCNSEDFDTDAVVVIERPAPDGSEYAQFFRRKRRLQITCSASIVDIVRNAIYGQAQEAIFDVAFVERALTGHIDQVLGPTYLGYLDALDSDRDDPNVRLLSRNEIGALDSLRAKVTAQDWKYSGLDPDQPIAGYFIDEMMVSAAGYEVWGDRIAHIGVLTYKSARRTGCGRACVRKIAAHAIAQGLIAQYQTLYDNSPSLEIARSLGFEDYAARIYVRATAQRQDFSPKMNKELTPGELAEAYLEQIHRKWPPSTEKPFNAAFLWRNLICEEPEKAWPVFLELLARRDDYETLEAVAYRLELLLSRHWDAFHERVEAMVREHSRLPRLLPDWALAREQFEFREATELQAQNWLPEEQEKLLSSWFGYKQTSWAIDAVMELTGEDPERLWTITMALVTAAPDERTLGYIAAGPLEDLLADYGEQFIERIERQAAADAKFRYCLAGVWRAGMSDELWSRVTIALGDQERYLN